MTNYQQPPWPEYAGNEPPGYGPPAGQPWQPPPAAPRKRKRIFRWVFLAIQVLFLIILIVGLTAHGSGPSVAEQTAKQCAGTGWEGLFKSHADCMTHYAVALHDATNTGTGIGVALVLVLWCVVDFLVGVPYAIWRLATSRGSHR